VTFDTIDAGGGQIDRSSTVEDVKRFDFSKVNPAFGPIYIEDAEPGDALEVKILSLETADWGWTANIPGFGLLADRFPEPALHLWNFDPRTREPALYKPGGRVPLRPFPGILGNAPPEPGLHSVVHPDRYGGNLDTRDICEGAVLLLPVGVPGALFSCGDGHAAQGDGEICGTAIETPMRMSLQFNVQKKAGLRFPMFSTPPCGQRQLDTYGYVVTMGIGPDLMSAARQSVNDMVDHVARTAPMSDLDAYLLLSVSADLRISEIVDAPHWVVTCHFPKTILSA
jgi:acetamidase/formamidase